MVVGYICNIVYTHPIKYYKEISCPDCKGTDLAKAGKVQEEMMLNDEIVEEVRANREAHTAKFNYDLRAIYDDLKKSEKMHIEQGCLSVEPADKIANKNMHTGKQKLRHFAL